MADPREEAPKLTIRTRIVEFVLAALAAAPFDPDNPGGPKLFDTVKMGELDDLTAMETPGCALAEGTDEVTENIGKTDKTLRLYFHVKVIYTKGVDPNPLVTYYFGRIGQLFVNVDQHLAGLALGVSEAGNSIERQGQNDPEPGGTMIIDIDYRHAVGDMFTE